MPAKLTLEPAPHPGSAKEIPLRVEADDDGIRVEAEAPGLLRHAQARQLMSGGIFGMAIGAFVAVGAVIGGLREFDWGSLPAIGIGGSLGGFVAWLGFIAFRWALIAGRGTTRVVIRPGQVILERTAPFPEQREIRADQYLRSTVTDQFKTVLELLVTVRGPRIVRILSGRSLKELEWLEDRIHSALSGLPRETADEAIQD
jgi:hypothetical protein